MAVLKQDEQEKIVDTIKKGVLIKFPMLGATMANLIFEPNSEIGTAATNGEKVYYSPEFVDKLSYEERVFLFSHEIMHDAFNHILRSKGKNPELWNYATDAVINQMLKKAKLPLPEGGIDIPEAINKSAEEMYEILQKQQDNQQQNGQGQNGEQSQNGEQDQSGENGNADQQDAQSKDQNQQNKQDQSGENNNQQDPNGEQEQGDKNGDADQQDQNGEQNQSSENGNNGQNQDGQSEEQNQQDGQNQNGQNQKGQQNGQQKGVGQHNLWKDAVEKAESRQQNGSGQSQSNNIQGQPQRSFDDDDDIEKEFTKRNEELKQKLGEKIRERLRKQREGMLKGNDCQGNGFSQMGNVGESSSVLSWKKILKRELEKEEDRWSYRRAEEDNDYQARIGTLESLDRPETEVMIDVSGSISTEMVREFLRQLKPLVKESKLKVGFFADIATKNFVEVKSKKDIDQLRIANVGYGTNVDNAVRAFSKKREVNKIVFTDGYAESPKPDLAKVNVIWLVYANHDFNPCCGKVIFVDEQEFEYMSSKNTDSKELTM